MACKPVMRIPLALDEEIPGYLELLGCSLIFL